MPSLAWAGNSLGVDIQDCDGVNPSRNPVRGNSQAGAALGAIRTSGEAARGPCMVVRISKKVRALRNS